MHLSDGTILQNENWSDYQLACLVTLSDWIVPSPGDFGSLDRSNETFDSSPQYKASASIHNLPINSEGQESTRNFLLQSVETLRRLFAWLYIENLIA